MFFSLYCKDASSSSCLLSTLVFGHYRQWWHHQGVHARLVYGSCFRLERGERGEGYSVGCNVQPHLLHAAKSYTLDLFKRSDPEGIFKQWLYQSYTSQISCLHYISLKDRWQKMCVYRLMYWYRILFLPHIGVGQRNCMLGPTYIGLWQCEGWFWTAVRYVQCIIC